MKAKQDRVRRNDPGSRRPGWALEDHYSIAILDVGSGGLTDLPSMTFSSFPTWSPDGTRIVFDGNDGLYIVATDGAGEPELVSNTHRTVSHPAWSPDWTRIAVSFKKNDNYDIAVMKVDGSGFLFLTESPYHVRQSNNVAPVWSPDGSRIAFLSDRTGTWQIYTLDVETEVVQPLPGQNLGAGIAFNDTREVNWAR